MIRIMDKKFNVMKRSLYLLGLIVWAFSACELEDPAVGVDIAEVITLVAADAELLANGRARTELTATVANDLPPNTVVTFRTERGSLVGSTDPTGQSLRVTALGRKARAVLVSNLEVEETVEVSAGVNAKDDPTAEFQTRTNLAFVRAYPDDLQLEPDRTVIAADRLDFANLSVQLTRDLGQPSNETRVEFVVTPQDSALVQVREFALADANGRVNVAVKSQNGLPGVVRIRAVSRDQAGDPVSDEVELVLE